MQNDLIHEIQLDIDYLDFEDAVSLVSIPYYVHETIETGKISNFMGSNSNLQAVAIVDNDMVVKGMFTRQQLLKLLSRPHGEALIQRRPITHFNTEKLVNFHSHDKIMDISKTLAQEIRESTSSKYFIVVDESNRFQGIFSSNDILAYMHDKVEEQSKEILASIQYAQFIQSAILPSKDLFQSFFQDYFIYWEPKDIVGGDFYWFHESEEHILLAVIDCTGHGVPGAFMTMISNAILNRIVEHINHEDPATIIQNLNQLVQETLKHGQGENLSHDGLEIGLCVIPKNKNHLVFSGSKFILIYSKDQEIVEIKGDKQSVGYQSSKLDYQYTNHVINLSGNEIFYLSSDGYFSQMGENMKRQIGRKPIVHTLKHFSERALNEQQKKLQNILKEYQGNESQRDDITIIGFRI
ncbi:MAG TPA: CBS domain-containing protein [Spirochaetes bacterium]|nr:CBS domain-containing protein [Spirochaetota bacterium]